MSPAIYQFRVDSDGFTPLEVVDQEELDLFIDGFAGQPMASEWPEPYVRFVEGDATPHGDFVGLFGGVPALSARVVDALGPAFENAGELLSLRSEAGEYWALNVTSVADVMDEQRSSGDWFAPGRLMTLQRLVVGTWTPSDLPPIFKLPQWLKGPPLLTQAFVDEVRSRGLRGLDARLLTGPSESSSRRVG